MNKKLVYSFFIIFILIIAVIALIWAIEKYESSKKCDYSDLNKTYIKKEKNCIINFLCIKDRVAFSDECGCGCKNIEQPKNNYCTSEQRAADVCYDLYMPVCGWFDGAKIQCIKYPCAQVYSNDCFACKDDKVLYWTDGECPK